MSMQTSGPSLFVRGEEESDIWDDTALIKAYDQAVSSVKVHLAKKNGDSIQSVEQDAGNLMQKKKHKKNKKKHKHKGKRHWKVGDQCRAIFKEDDTMYDAVIVSLHEEEGTCIVCYQGYNNEEEQKLTDLLVPHRRHQRQESGSNVDSDMDCTPGPNPGIRPHRHSGGPPPPNPPPPTWPWPQLPHVIPPFSAMPPVFPSSPGFPAWTDAQSPFSSQRPSFIPPPPPVPDSLEEDNEAMCSMLMSWYMSGYHTGYYQGLKDGKKQQGPQSKQESGDVKR